MELIDREALLRAYDAEHKGPAGRARMLIEEALTIDAVEVVRCKDCKHRPKVEGEHISGFNIEFPDYVCPCQCTDGFYNWMPNDDWYCADGEREADETD